MMAAFSFFGVVAALLHPLIAGFGKGDPVFFIFCNYFLFLFYHKEMESIEDTKFVSEHRFDKSFYTAYHFVKRTHQWQIVTFLYFSDYVVS